MIKSLVYIISDCSYSSLAIKKYLENKFNGSVLFYKPYEVSFNLSVKILRKETIGSILSKIILEDVDIETISVNKKNPINLVFNKIDLFITKNKDQGCHYLSELNRVNKSHPDLISHIISGLNPWVIKTLTHLPIDLIYEARELVKKEFGINSEIKIKGLNITMKIIIISNPC